MSRERLIDKVNALLAKAASSEHEAEQLAFEAKAQALITRHHIEQGELALGSVHIVERTIDIENWGNATRGVVHLFSGIAEANRCSVGHRTTRGRASIVLFGSETDADLTSALVDHLLPQLRTSILRDRPRSRMSYSIGWAHEVIERLRQAQEREAEASSALVPTNVAADEALRSAHRVRTGRASTVMPDEFDSGMSAGGEADIGRAKVAEPEPSELGG